MKKRTKKGSIHRKNPCIGAKYNKKTCYQPQNDNKKQGIFLNTGRRRNQKRKDAIFDTDRSCAQYW